MTRVCRLFALLALTTLPLGCIPKIAYTPNTGILQEIGYEQGQTMLAEILARARAPRIIHAEVTSEFFTYTVSHVAPGWDHYGIVDNVMQIFYSNVRNVDIYANDRVFVYDVAGRKVSQFDFLQREDSLHFADLVMAFRDSGTSWPAPHNESPAPQDDYPEPRDDYQPPPRREPPPPPPPADDYEEEHTSEPLLEKDAPPDRERDREPDVEPYPGDDEENTRSLFDED